MKKRVFLILVTYNGEKWLKKCLDSVFNSTYPVSVIAIDNNSNDATLSILNQYNEIDIIDSKSNLGFGKANNIGIEKALNENADYLFLLNQDTWIFPDTIKSLVDAAEKNENYGIISPLHYSGDEKTLDSSFKTYWERKTSTLEENIDEVPFVNAAAWLLPAHVVKKVGYFEPMFDHYGEDRNYVERVKYHDFKIVITNNARICHDRIPKRVFKKDVIQSKYTIQAEILNINHNLIYSYWKGFISVFGLPKFFLKIYPVKKSILMFFKLMGFYIKLNLKLFKIIKIRNSYK
ncbi:glycosyltransferase family 2 protein [Mangrovivirga sp. M17]|uniref:Glycosyltransferase family 2 protein n=1 Tax=Mangrovivirga halotolerans TaxID=2993936 RepID=A0ABT3RN69_9BACT|nr:glycosyltransferase family 2 protein [Mangrovivirga halotolerans]MCX2743037.1 glycosyltransferase family 2 protein [Mangrovivirga halotolerans]